jgi:hypothetical protein
MYFRFILSPLTLNVIGLLRRYIQVPSARETLPCTTFRHYILVLPCLLLAPFIKLTILQVRVEKMFAGILMLDLLVSNTGTLDSFSVYLEAIGIAPQLMLLETLSNVLHYQECPLEYS